MANKIETTCRVPGCGAPIYRDRPTREHPTCENGHPVPQDQIDELREETVVQKLDGKRQGKKKTA